LEHKFLEQLRAALRRYVVPRRHSAFLAAIVALFIVRSFIGYNRITTAAFSIALLLLLLFAIYVVEIDELVGERQALLAQTRRHTIIGWALALPAIAERLAIVSVPSRALHLAGLMWWLLLFSFITWSQLRSLLKQRNITSETISMSISAYLLIGFTWGLFYILLHHLQPSAFSFGGSTSPKSGERKIFPLFFYFSLSTLSTIGCGDISPITMQARYAVVAESITGQFYLAILVARIVGMQMSHVATHHRTASQESR
jgi:ion channel